MRGVGGCDFHIPFKTSADKAAKFHFFASKNCAILSEEGALRAHNHQKFAAGDSCLLSVNSSRDSITTMHCVTLRVIAVIRAIAKG